MWVDPNSRWYEARTDRHARHVINGVVDAFARRQLLHHRRQTSGVGGHGLLGVERPCIRVDHGHAITPVATIQAAQSIPARRIYYLLK